MYDTEKRVELVKKRMYEYRRRKERHRVYHLSALCALLFLSLAGALGTVQTNADGCRRNVWRDPVA